MLFKAWLLANTMGSQQKNIKNIEGVRSAKFGCEPQKGFLGFNRVKKKTFLVCQIFDAKNYSNLVWS